MTGQDPTAVTKRQPAANPCPARPAFALSCWPGLDLLLASEDIRAAKDWMIREDRHCVIVHLGGRMDKLETELDGHGGSCGSALPGEVWTVPAGRNYASRAQGDRICYGVFYWEPDTWSPALEMPPIVRDFRPVAGLRDEFLHQATCRLRELTAQPGDLSQMLAESLVHAVNRHLFHRYGESPLRTGAHQHGPGLAPATARRLRDFIHEKLGEPLSLAALAGVAGLSVHQLLTAFRRTFGTTPAQYLITQRLRQAQRLLAAGRLDITTIALQAGFASHSHLTSTFRRRFGYTPQQYRQRAH